VRSGAQPSAPGQRASTRDELRDAERLGEVIIGAALESENQISFLPPGGQHENRHIRIAGVVVANGAAHTDAVEARQQEIQDNQIEMFSAREPEPGFPVRNGHTLVPRRPKLKANQLSDHSLVIDDQHPPARCSLPGRGRALANVAPGYWCEPALAAFERRFEKRRSHRGNAI